MQEVRLIPVRSRRIIRAGDHPDFPGLDIDAKTGEVHQVPDDVAKWLVEEDLDNGKPRWEFVTEEDSGSSVYEPEAWGAEESPDDPGSEVS